MSRLIGRCGASYWVAPGAALSAMVLLLLLSLLSVLPSLLLSFLELYLLTAVFAVTGAVIRPFGVVDDIEIPDSPELYETERRAKLTEDRVRVLNHAYGFVSRENRDGGLGHIYDWLARDPDPDSAWRWFFDEMLRWENTYPALLLAQQYVGRLLELDREIEAVKLIGRCLLIDESFRPLSHDLPRAIAAAESCGNPELAAALSR